MIAGLPLAFLNPLMLIGLAALPAIWLLLRLVPPRPRVVPFPPARLLRDIEPKEETPARTPWWLTALRLGIAALVILAVAGPVWNPPVANRESRGPLLMLVDDTWAAAPTWEVRMRTAGELVDAAEAAGRPIAVVPLGTPPREIATSTPALARDRLRILRPVPHHVDRAEAMPAIERYLRATPEAEIVWLADGIDTGTATAFVDALRRMAEGRTLTVFAQGLGPARALTAADNAAGALSVRVLRPGPASPGEGTVRALDLRGLPLGETRFSFAATATETDAKFDLPVEIRNDIARLEIVGERSAGAVALLDSRWRRRTVGIVATSGAEQAQPLLSAQFYLTRALGPFADLRVAETAAPGEAITRLINDRLPVIVLADVGTIAAEARERLGRWVEQGGVLIRFAGPRLAAATNDDLLPVDIRRGGRVLGGSLSWEQPQQLAAFSRDGPFSGMPVPTDVTVTRQVLAEPDAQLAERTWATLGDGTPLVTGARRGRGLVVLFHVTADTRWSDLPLSGALVEMLRRIVGLAGSVGTSEAGGATGRPAEAVPPNRLLDGTGAFGPPPATARPLALPAPPRATAENPPGFYGPADGLVALGTLATVDRLAPIDFSRLGATIESYRAAAPTDLKGPLVIAALLLFLVDALLVLWLGGGLARLIPRPRDAGAAILVALGLGLAAAPALAQQPLQLRPEPFPQMRGTLPGQPPAPGPNASPEEFALRGTLETRLAYVLTGDREVDNISRVGLEGLTTFLTQRTAVEPADPVGVDISKDELSFFALLYWPIVPSVPKPSPQTLARIDAFMKQGGMVLFDTRDALLAPPGPQGQMQGPGMRALREILSSLDVPELEPVPRDHVLTKAFYLLRDFPGRYASGTLWVEASGPEDDTPATERPARPGDGVSSILITSNDFAAAWATDRNGNAMFSLLPGDGRQREMAFRAGVNIVIYAFTGNYKADQVHVPALLERLGN